MGIGLLGVLAGKQLHASGADQTATEGEASYTVYIDFTPDADTRYGMQALITTVDTDDEIASSDESDSGTTQADSDSSESQASSDDAEANSDAPQQ